MRIFSSLLLLCLFPLTVMAAGQPEKDDPYAALQWKSGPGADPIAAKATLNVPADVAYINESDSSKFLELSGNLPEPGNFIVVSKKDNWWATFSFDAIGYVKDDEKIDADALLKQMKENDEPENAERRKRGLGELHLEGWYVPPHYDPATKRLEWGLKLRSDHGVTLNYTIRLLGRTGVMDATLISSPETLDADVKSFKAVLNGFDFNSGERYGEFRAGDHVAEIGLGALVLGGAAAVAAKKGFFTVIFGFLAAAWKFIAVAFVGLMAKVRSLFSKKRE